MLNINPYSSSIHTQPQPAIQKPQQPAAEQTQTAAVEAENDAVLAAVKNADLQKIGGEGGHGGFMKGTVTVDGQERSVFLKPLDKAESSNYAFLQKNASSKLQEFMPRVYGKVDRDGKEFLVMQDLYSGGRKQIADVKLSKGGIVSQDEMQATRGKPKKLTTWLRMTLEPKLSPGFMVAQGAKWQRTFLYFRSDSALKEKLGAGVDTKKLEKLSGKLGELEAAMEKSPMAFIGASLFIFKDKNGDYSVHLGDPAHAQVKPGVNSEIQDLYHGASNSGDPVKDTQNKAAEFSDRITANRDSIQAIRKTIDTKIAEEKTKQISSGKLNAQGLTPQGPLPMIQHHASLSPRKSFFEAVKRLFSRT